MSKKPKTINKPKIQKHPTKAVDPSGYLHKNPSWEFNRIDYEHSAWSIKKCNFNEILLDKLVNFERQTWAEISIKGDKNNHHVNVSSFIKEAQSRLLELKIIEDELFSLRLSSRERLYGILKDGVYQIIWYDSEHKICPSHKKHT